MSGGDGVARPWHLVAVITDNAELCQKIHNAYPQAFCRRVSHDVVAQDVIRASATWKLVRCPADTMEKGHDDTSHEQHNPLPTSQSQDSVTGSATADKAPETPGSIEEGDRLLIEVEKLSAALFTSMEALSQFKMRTDLPKRIVHELASDLTKTLETKFPPPSGSKYSNEAGKSVDTEQSASERHCCGEVAEYPAKEWQTCCLNVGMQPAMIARSIEEANAVACTLGTPGLDPTITCQALIAFVETSVAKFAALASPPAFTPELLETFDGEREKYSTWEAKTEAVVNAYVDPAWRMAACTAIPSKLQGDAACWLLARWKHLQKKSGLSDEILTWEVIRDDMRRHFRRAEEVAEQKADDRIWDLERESTTAYLTGKLAEYHSMAKCPTEAHLVAKIQAGMPKDLQKFVPTNIKKVDEIVDLLISQEPIWRGCSSSKGHTGLSKGADEGGILVQLGNDIKAFFRVVLYFFVACLGLLSLGALLAALSRP